MYLAEEVKIVPVMRPQDATGAAFTTEWISMKDYGAADFVVNLGGLTSTSTQAVTLKVANVAAGTKSKAITSASAACTLTLGHYHKTGSSTDDLVKASVTSSTFNITKSSDSKYVVVHVDANHMGTFIASSVTYDADYVAISVGTCGTHACLAAVDCYLSKPRYASQSLPTAIT